MRSEADVRAPINNRFHFSRHDLQRAESALPSAEDVLGFGDVADTSDVMGFIDDARRHIEAANAAIIDATNEMVQRLLDEQNEDAKLD